MARDEMPCNPPGPGTAGRLPAPTPSSNAFRLPTLDLYALPHSAGREGRPPRPPLTEQVRAVREHEHRPSAAAASRSAMKRARGRLVEVLGRLVEDEDRPVGEDRPRELEPLPLAARQPGAVLADRRREAVRQRRPSRGGAAARSASRELRRRTRRVARGGGSRRSSSRRGAGPARTARSARRTSSPASVPDVDRGLPDDELRPSPRRGRGTAAGRGEGGLAGTRRPGHDDPLARREHRGRCAAEHVPVGAAGSAARGRDRRPSGPSGTGTASTGSGTGSGRRRTSVSRAAEAASPGSWRAAGTRRATSSWAAMGTRTTTASATPEQAAVPHRADADDERRPDGRPGRDARHERPDRRPRARTGARPGRGRRRPPRRPRPRPARRPRQGARARRAAGRAPWRPGLPAQARSGPPHDGRPRGGERRADRGRDERHAEHEARRRHERAHDDHGPGPDDRGRCVRQEDARPEVDEPVHVGDEPREQVARSKVGEATAARGARGVRTPSRAAHRGS